MFYVNCTDEVKSALERFCSEHLSQEFADFLYYLRNRYEDEKEYEDFSEYVDAMKKKFPEVAKMTKRPFGVIWDERISVGKNTHSPIYSIRTFFKVTGNKLTLMSRAKLENRA